MKPLTDRQRLVLEARLGLRGPVPTFTQLGAAMGLTKQSVSQLEARALRTLGRAAARCSEGLEVPPALLTDLDRYRRYVDLRAGDLGEGFVSFEEARTYAQSLQLKAYRDWLLWCKSGQRPNNIPSNPNKAYRGKGWAGWPDFLGYEAGRK